MKTFAIKICPLCKQQMKLFYSGDQRKYYCITPRPNQDPLKRIQYEDHSISHYQVIFNFGIILQQIYLEEYLIESDLKGDKTTVYLHMPPFKFKPDGTIVYFKSRSVGLTGQDLSYSKILMQIPLLTLTDPDKILKKIKLLLPFS